jgi:hypothetical protein
MLVVPPTSATFEFLRDVMSTELIGDTTLIDLYKNKGSADPGLVAAVLELQAPDVGAFFADTWTIVSEDKGVKRKASEFGIEVVESSSLAGLIDASEMRAATDQ